MAGRRPVLVGLYVPGDRPERFAKALGAGADQVIIDLEDAVAPDHKALARDAVADLLRSPSAGRLAVRPNGAGTPWYADDLTMLAAAPYRPALRLPKVDGPDDVDRVLEFFPDADAEVACLLESAVGIESALAIARHRAVSAIALGEADLRAELGITADAALDWIRVRIVVAARAAGLDPPNMAVYPGLDDSDGLVASCRRGATLGMLGRTALHPKQIELIRRAFQPEPAEISRAESVLAALTGGVGVATLADGRMVDEAMAAQARRVLRIRDLTQA